MIGSFISIIAGKGLEDQGCQSRDTDNTVRLGLKQHAHENTEDCLLALYNFV